MNDAVNQSKRLQGTVISMEDDEKQVKSQHGTVISTNDTGRVAKNLLIKRNSWVNQGLPTLTPLLSVAHLRRSR